MIRATFDFDIPHEAEIIDIGKTTTLGHPQYSVGVYINEALTFVLQVYFRDETDAFHDVKCSKETIVVGYGEKVYIFNISDKTIKSLML